MTLTATSQNFSNGHFKFTGDGISDEGSYSDEVDPQDTTDIPIDDFLSKNGFSSKTGGGGQVRVEFWVESVSTWVEGMWKLVSAAACGRAAMWRVPRRVLELIASRLVPF